LFNASVFQLQDKCIAEELLQDGLTLAFFSHIMARASYTRGDDDVRFTLDQQV